MVLGSPELPEDIQEAGSQPHGINALISEFDWRRVCEAATLEQSIRGTRISASNIVRTALNDYLNNHTDAETIAELAQLRLRHKQELDVRRSQVKEILAQPQNP